MTQKIPIQFRFPIEQTNLQELNILIDRNSGPSMFNVEFVKHTQLTDHEIENAEIAVLKEIAILK